MEETFAPNIHSFILKLDHSQEEVRVRALNNIASKLNYGIVQAIDLASDRLLISKLLQWLDKSDTQKKADCLNLLLRICKEEVGCKTVVSLGGLQFFQSLKSEVHLDCHPIIDSILEQLYLNCHSFEPDTSEALVYASQSARVSSNAGPDSKSKREIQKGSALEGTLVPNTVSHQLTPVNDANSEQAQRQEWYSQDTPSYTTGESGFLVVDFPWIVLCSTDMHVLESTNQSLVSQDSQLIVSACDFIVDVMLFDFPAEIFLQRPLIVKTLMKLLQSLSDGSKAMDVSLSIVGTLINLCDCLKDRINFHRDPATFAPKQDILALGRLSASEADASSIEQSRSSASSEQCSRPSVVGVSDDSEDKTQSTSVGSDEYRTKSSHRSVSVQMTSLNVNELELQNLQLLLPDFCLNLHKCVLSLVDRCTNRLALELLRLLTKLQTMLKLSVTATIWADNSQYARELCNLMRGQMAVMAHLAIKIHQSAATNQKTVRGNRSQMYILLSQLSLDLYDLVPSSHLTDVIGSGERQLLYTLCCDESLAQSIPSIRQRAAAVLKLVDTSSHDVYLAARVICDSMDMCCRFLLASPHAWQDVKEVLKLVNQAEKAIYSIPYHMNTDLIAAYVELCSHSYKKAMSCDEEVVDYMMSTLLKYLAHPLQEIKKETYMSIVKVVKSCLSFDVPTRNVSEGIRFLLHHGLLWEVACFGLTSDIPEVIAGSQDVFNYLMQSRMLVSKQLWLAICRALLPILPVIQSYASADTTLGKCLLALTDTHFDANISTVHCIKGALRMLFVDSKSARTHSTKVLMAELNSVYSSYLLYPLTDVSRYEAHIIHMDVLVREHDADSTQRAVLNEDSVMRVLRVFLADGVEPSVRLTSLNQLAIVLQNPHTHKYFLERDGFSLTLKTIADSILPDRTSEDEEATPPAVSILASLLQFNGELRAALAADVKHMLTLLRCCWLFPNSTRTSVEAAQCISYIVLDEICPRSSSAVLSLPRTCCVRYKLPLRVISYCDQSSHRIDMPPVASDPITQPLPLQMLRIFWNICWHGKVEYLLDSVDKQPVDSGSARLKLTPADIHSLKECNTLYAVFRSLQSITNATSHETVSKELNTLTAYSLVCAQGGDHMTMSAITWNTYFSRFLSVEPVAQQDKELLTRILTYFTTLVNLGMPKAKGNLLSHLYAGLSSEKDSVLLSLVHGSAYSESTDNSIKRSIQNSLLTLLGAVGIDTHHSLTSGSCSRGSLVQAVLKRLTMADASNFYNLASLESSVIALLRLTSRLGWSLGCADIDSHSLCSQLIKALFEVLSAFHLGRQGNSLSYMGKGVLRNATLCLRHVMEEVKCVVKDDESWLTPWVEGSEGETRLEWLRSLWNYRDQEVRAAALGMSVALVHSSAELETIFTSVTDMVHDAAYVVIDSTECSLVRRQAAVLVSNLITSVHSYHLQRGTDAAGKRQLVAVYGVLETLNYFPEILSILTSDIFLDLNIDSIDRQVRPEQGDSVFNVVYPTVATPAFLSSAIQGLLLLSTLLPSNTLPGLQQANVIQRLAGFYSNAAIKKALVAESDDADQSRLRCEVIGLCADVLSLLRSCVIQSSYLRNRSLSVEAASHVADILHLLSNKPSEGDVCKATHRVWKDLFLYLTAHLHVDLESNVCMDGVILSNLIQFWSLFTEMSVHLLKSEREEERICVLEFWSVVLGLLYVRDEGVKVKQMLDGEKPFGGVLHRCLLPLYDAMLLRYSDRDCVQERLAVINCLKSLLSVSVTAKAAALQDGLVESLLSHINSFINKLHMLAASKLGALKEQGNGYLAELVVNLELATNFMLADDEVKQAMSDVGLANLVHRLWFYCESDVQLMMTCIATLTTYTENSSTACRHMVCTSIVSCLGMPTDRLQIQSNSLADILVRLMHTQLNKMHPNMDLLSKLFRLMSNLCMSPDTLSSICKNSFAGVFASANHQQLMKKRPKIQKPLHKLWMSFYLNLSYTVDGQKLILAVKDSVQLLVEQLDSSDSAVKEMVLIILYNLSVGCRSKMLTNDCVPLTAVSVLEDSDSSQPLMTYAVDVLQALVYDSMKGKAIVKGLCVPERLEDLLNSYKQRELRTNPAQEKVSNVALPTQQLLTAIRE